MGNYIKLTVIIPVYNQEELVIKALDSIPTRKDIEIIVVDDGSSDHTYNNLVDYVENHKEKNILLLKNLENKGVGYTRNVGYDNAKGEYITMLGSDDDFYEGINEVIDLLDGTDIVYYDLRINDGSIFHLSQATKKSYCGSVKCIRREFLGETRCQNIRYMEDWVLFNALLMKKPTEKFTNIVAKHYNYPRENSLTYNKVHQK